MFNHPYITQKLMEYEKGPTIRLSPRQLPPLRGRANRFARSVGRAMRTAGERLETWAGPGPQSPADYFPEARRY